MLKTALWPLAAAGMIGLATLPVLAQQAATPATTTTTTTATPAAGDAAATTTVAPAAGDAAATTTTAAEATAGTPVAFPSSQVRHGNLEYRQSCAGCHGAQLEGYLENPPLSGADFQSHWWGQPLSNLYSFISTNMPLDAPGSLSPEQYAQITTFILSKNGIEPDDSAPELPGDATALQTMMLPPVGGAAPAAGDAATPATPAQ